MYAVSYTHLDVYKRQTLTYTKGEKFSAANLKAVFRLNGREVVWTPGTEDPQDVYKRQLQAFL